MWKQKCFNNKEYKDPFFLGQDSRLSNQYFPQNVEGAFYLWWIIKGIITNPFPSAFWDFITNHLVGDYK